MSKKKEKKKSGHPFIRLRMPEEHIKRLYEDYPYDAKVPGTGVSAYIRGLIYEDWGIDAD